MKLISILKHSAQLIAISFILTAAEKFLLSTLGSEGILININGAAGIGLMYIVTWTAFRSFNEAYGSLSATPFLWLSLLFIMSSCVGVGLSYIHILVWKHIFALVLQKGDLLIYMLTIITWLSNLVVRIGFPWFMSWQSGKALMKQLTEKNYLRF